MAYNPQTAISKIYNLKGLWEEANNSGNETKKNDAAAKAREYYNQLRDNGYADVADALTASNYSQAKAINDKWAKTGKTATRDYMYSLGKSRGMSESDVDKLISWDNQSGEVSFGGKKIGAPDAVVDGVSYWADTSVLDNAFNDYISRSGTTRSKSVAVDQENEDLFAKYRQEYDDLKSTNPFTTEEAKAILAKYDLAGLQGRDNAVAENAPSNGGNIDSFAAANALRQQSALVSQGQTAVLEAYQQKLDHARALLSDMGVNIDRVFNQDETVKNREFEQGETAKNNDVANKLKIASATGTPPIEWVLQNDPFYKNFVDENGKLTKEAEALDFQALINDAKAKGNTELANKYAYLRGLKIYGNLGKYGQYLSEGDVAASPSQTSIAISDSTLPSILSKATTSISGSGSGSGSGTVDDYQKVYDSGARSYDEAYLWFRENTDMNVSDAQAAARVFEKCLNNGEFEPYAPTRIPVEEVTADVPLIPWEEIGEVPNSAQIQYKRRDYTSELARGIQNQIDNMETEPTTEQMTTWYSALVAAGHKKDASSLLAKNGYSIFPEGHFENV